MNEDNLNNNLKSEVDLLIPQPPHIPRPPTIKPAEEQHPLHMLDNQADPENKPKIILQKAIRTYESDVADVLANQKTNVATVAIAESERKQSQMMQGATNLTRGIYSETNSQLNIENNPEHTDSSNSNYGKKILISMLSLIFIIAGVIGGYYLYLKSPLVPIAPIATKSNIPSIITPNKQKIISINNESGDQLIKNISKYLQDQSIMDDSINEIILTQMIGSTTVKVSSSDFINKISSKAPDILTRSLTNQWMIGSYNIDNKNLPFIILKTDFFQNTFSGMLKWETSLPDEFSSLLNYKAISINNSDGLIASYFNIRGKFEDRTVLNRDVREFINDNGELLILYSFIDKDTLVIATSEATLKSIIGKIEKQTYIRYN